jgi:nucleotidyltransferase/DNA polymerase involved in DNA repair
MRNRAIVHLDADAFFAAVEQASDPKLRGKPFAVGGEKRGIIASASYEARRYGIYTPMPTARARKLCPNLIVLSGDFERYEQFSTWMFGYAYDFTPDVEQTSIDEGYFDLTGTAKPAVEIAEIIRKAISQRLKITVSEGIGTNKLVSAVASKLMKPAAFHEVPAGSEAAFLHPLPNKWLPGIGPKTSIRLNAAGLAMIHHVASTPLSMLELLLGNQAATIRKFADGIDERPLIPEREPQKSFSEQETFPTDLTDSDYIEAVLLRMADNLFSSVRGEGRSIRTLTVRVRYNDMAEDQASESLPEPTDLETEVYCLIRTLLRKAWKRRVSLRLVSLKLSNCYRGAYSVELPILPKAKRRDSNAKLIGSIDALRKVHGAGIILRAHDLRLREPPLDALAKPAAAPGGGRIQVRPVRPAITTYTPLRCHSHYSFLDSTLSPTALVTLAKQNGLQAVALTDTGNLHGAVEFVQAAKNQVLNRFWERSFASRASRCCSMRNPLAAINNLCRLLSRHAELGAKGGDEGSVAAGKQRRSLHPHELAGLYFRPRRGWCDPRLAEHFPKAFYQMVMGGTRAASFLPWRRPAIHYGLEADRQRYDILQSIRTLTLLRQLIRINVWAEISFPHRRRNGGGLQGAS